MKFLRRKLLFIFSFTLGLVGPHFLCAQPDAEVVILSPLVGPTIEHSEYQRYHMEEVLGKDQAEIDSLRLIPLTSESYLLFFYYKDGNTEGHPIPQSELAFLKNAIHEKAGSLWQAFQELKALSQTEYPLPIRVILWGGEEIWGEVEEVDALGFVLRDQGLDQRYLRLEDVATLDLSPEAPIDQNAILQRANRLMGHQYLLTTSALPLERGESYYQNLGFLVNTIGFTPFRGLTVAAGTELSLIFLSAIAQQLTLPLYVRVSYSQPLNERWYIGSGINTFGIITRSGVAGIAHGFASTTYQGKNLQATLSLGWGVGLDQISAVGNQTYVGQNPTISLGTRLSVTNWLSLVSESWYIRSGNRNGNDYNFTNIYALSAGPRLEIWDMSLDFLLVYFGFTNQRRVRGGAPIQNNFFMPIPLPMLTFRYYFGPQK